jgi:hypothetical protein
MLSGIRYWISVLQGNCKMLSGIRYWISVQSQVTRHVRLCKEECCRKTNVDKNIYFQVEKFKVTQSPKNALHSKFDMITGDPVTRDDDDQHLQIDCVAMFLLFLVEMIESGLQVSLSFLLECYHRYASPSDPLLHACKKFGPGSRV